MFFDPIYVDEHFIYLTEKLEKEIEFKSKNKKIIFKRDNLVPEQINMKEFNDIF